MTELVKYEAARRALAEAVAVDEVLQIRDEWKAIEAAAHIMKNLDLEVQAAQLRFRAQRRLGELVAKQRETVGLHRGGRPKKTDSAAESVSVPTLRDAGIEPKESMRAQRMAAVPAAEFEALIARHAEEVRSGKSRVATDLLKVGAEEKGRAHRRDLAAALSGKTAELPSGQRFPAVYLDPPWQRQGGIGDRAYENHYPTMAWPDIRDYLRQVRDRLLPDAWAFMWIPRAHLLAPVELERELQVKATGELVVIADRVPLAWACQLALGCQAYSTCFVWTKTDADHPDVSGTGLIARDQDELLLLFKRGQGLPKPEAGEKFGSNHRERPREHSRKPEFYRSMIATMVGRDSAGQPLPVLELFARVDAENPLPPNWQAAGNQAGAPAIAIADAVQSIEDPVSALAPSGDETVTAAAEATSAGASAAAAVTDIPAFLPATSPALPPTEFTDLQRFVDLAKGDQAAAIAPAYLTRGLVEDWCGGWKLTGAGRVRLDVLKRERAEREAMFRARLDEPDFLLWRGLATLAAGESLDGDPLLRGLVGDGLVHVTGDCVIMLDAGREKLAELDAMVVVEAAPLPPATPYQLDLVQYLEGVK